MIRLFKKEKAFQFKSIDKQGKHYPVRDPKGFTACGEWK